MAIAKKKPTRKRYPQRHVRKPKKRFCFICMKEIEEWGAVISLELPFQLRGHSGYPRHGAYMHNSCAVARATAITQSELEVNGRDM